MGQAYPPTDTKLGCNVAIKVLLAEMAWTRSTFGIWDMWLQDPQRLETGLWKMEAAPAARMAAISSRSGRAHASRGHDCGRIVGKSETIRLLA